MEKDICWADVLFYGRGKDVCFVGGEIRPAGQWPKAKTLAQVEFISAEHLKSTGLGTQKEGHPIRMSFFFGASDEARTRYLHLGKVALYQMSYTRISKGYIITLPQECQGEFSKVPKKFCGTEVVPSPR